MEYFFPSAAKRGLFFSGKKGRRCLFLLSALLPSLHFLSFAPQLLWESGISPQGFFWVGEGGPRKIWRRSNYCELYSILCCIHGQRIIWLLSSKPPIKYTTMLYNIIQTIMHSIIHIIHNMHSLILNFLEIIWLKLYVILYCFWTCMVRGYI